MGKLVAPLLLLPALLTSASQIHRYNLYNASVGVEDHKKAALWADKLIPQTSVVVSVYHSGAVRYYMNRSSLSFDLMTPERWSVVKDRIKEKGYQLYALLMHNEPDLARPRIPGKWTQIGSFNGHTTLWRIDPE